MRERSCNLGGIDGARAGSWSRQKARGLIVRFQNEWRCTAQSSCKNAEGESPETSLPNPSRRVTVPKGEGGRHRRIRGGDDQSGDRERRRLRAKQKRHWERREHQRETKRSGPVRFPRFVVRDLSQNVLDVMYKMEIGKWKTKLTLACQPAIQKFTTTTPAPAVRWDSYGRVAAAQSPSRLSQSLPPPAAAHAEGRMDRADRQFGGRSFGRRNCTFFGSSRWTKRPSLPHGRQAGCRR